MNDEALLEQSLAGDSAAFGELVRKYQDRLFNTLLRLTGCREEAEDVAQEAFVQAYFKLHTFQQNSAFYTWLYRIAFNVGISRRRRRRHEMSVDWGKEVAGAEPVDDLEMPEVRLEREERAEQLQEAIQTLSEEHRAILILREMEGCCYETIAEVLDLPIGTVRSRLHRARMQLRDYLKEALGEPAA